jgi:antitoxin component of MazEF toxin-antitoxin module
MFTTKLTRVGNSTSVTLPRDLLAAAHLERGDEVVLDVVNGKIEIGKSVEGYNEAMAIGRAFNLRYRQTMAILSR